MYQDKYIKYKTKYIQLQQGGKKYGEGAKGYVMDVFFSEDQQADDRFVLSKILSNHNNSNKTLYFLDNSKRPAQLVGDIILKELNELSPNILCKVFVNKNDFLRELDRTRTLYSIFNTKIEKIDNDALISNNVEYTKKVPNFISQDMIKYLAEYDNKIKINNWFYDKDIKMNHTIVPIKMIGNDILGMSIMSNYYLFTEKCSKTLDKYIIGEREEQKETISLKKMLYDIIYSIIYLQSNNFAHCDIKADNIIICQDKFKLIDWDLAMPTNEFDMNARYFGSSTHSSPVIVKVTPNIGQQAIQKIAGIAKLRNIDPNHKLIQPEVIDYLIKNPDFLVRYHIDMYSFAITLLQIDANNLYVSNNSFRELVEYLKNIHNNDYLDKLIEIIEKQDTFLV